MAKWAAALTAARYGSSALTLAAIAVQIADLAASGAFRPANFFSFFTIQSNLIGVAALLLAASARRSPAIERLRGAATVYLSVTFIVFALLLSGIDVETALPWVDFVLHKLFPVVVVADWIAGPAAVRLTWRDAGVWMIYPLLWTGYALLRGALTGWYPYPFLNPVNGGYQTVAIYVAAIVILGIAVCAGVVGLSEARKPRD